MTMKRLPFLFVIFLAFSCSTLRVKPEQGKVVIGISRNGIPEAKRANFAKCIHDAGAEVFFFPTYPENDSILNSYLDRIDCLIIPGSGATDTVGRKYYDARIIKAAIGRGMPLLGICEGHQRINQVLGGQVNKISDFLPDSGIQHKVIVNGVNVGAVSEAHPIRIDRKSALFGIYHKRNLMVNTSHRYCSGVMSDKLRVVAVAPDGIVEAYEAPWIMGLQFHPEYMYGNMGLKKHLKVFKYFASQGRSYREKNL